MWISPNAACINMPLGYAVDGGDVQVVDLACGEQIPDEIISALSDTSVTKWAFNAMFERVCLSNFLGEWLEPEGWHCTMVWSATLGLPLSLETAGAALGLEKQKLTEGKDLIRYFCVPCKPTKANGGRTRNRSEHNGSRHITSGMWRQKCRYRNGSPSFR